MTVKVLLVDDHTMFRQGIRALLEKESELEVVGETGDGQTAIDMALELDPDVIVLDVEMPDIDGMEVTRQVISKNPSAKILALSRHSERGFVYKMFSLGALGYILKDAALEELVKAIETLASDEKYLSPSLIEVVLDDRVDYLNATKEYGLSKLTAREKEVLIFIAEGSNSKEIAFILNLSAKTVDAHRHQIMNKLDIHNVADLTRFAIRVGLVKP